MGTFNTICFIILNLFPGFQAAVRNVAEVYHILSLHKSQWNGTVVHLLEEDEFAIDTSATFGATPNTGAFSHITDANVDIMCSISIRPILKWVNDHVFFCVPIHHIPAYNNLRCKWRTSTLEHRDKHHTEGWIWYRRCMLPDGSIEEFNNNMKFPVLNCWSVFPRSKADNNFPYSLVDIDQISDRLDILWQKKKDQNFDEIFTFMGFV